MQIRHKFSEVVVDRSNAFTSCRATVRTPDKKEHIFCLVPCTKFTELYVQNVMKQQHS